MPIRIRCRDKLRYVAHPKYYKRYSASLAGAPIECYTERKPKVRVLCESI